MMQTVFKTSRAMQLYRPWTPKVSNKFIAFRPFSSSHVSRMPPLTGTKVVEIAGLAPAPFAGMFLADFGSDVVRVDRVGAFNPDNLARGKRSVALDLRSEEGKQVFLKLIDKADILIEPFRPGVMERLGLGPDILMKRNPRLIYARMTGFGQEGRYAKMAGHDINYIAASGVLSTMGRAEPDKPYFPLNILGDFAGGGFLCAVGCLLALLERHTSGKGQIVDAAMCDGAAYLASFIYKAKFLGEKSPMWPRPRGQNMLDGGAHFYEIYRCKDGKYMSVGAIEPQFYAELLKGMGLDPSTLPDQNDHTQWPALKVKFQEVFMQKTRDEWAAIFDGTDACTVPIFEMEEVVAGSSTHLGDRNCITPIQGTDGSKQHHFEPAAAPRLSRTPAIPPGKSPSPGQHTDVILKEWLNMEKSQVDSLVGTGKVGRAKL